MIFERKITNNLKLNRKIIKINHKKRESGRVCPRKVKRDRRKSNLLRENCFEMNGKEINQTKEGGESVYYRIECQMFLEYMTLPKWDL